MRRIANHGLCLALGLGLASAGALAQPAATPWLDGGAHREFRQRVIELALIYGESSGIDPQGWRVQVRQLRELPGHCALVEVTVSQDGAATVREELPACRAHPPA